MLRKLFKVVRFERLVRNFKRKETKMWMAEAEAKTDIPLDNFIVSKNSKITITRGKNEKYAIWDNRAGIYVYRSYKK